MTNDLAEAQQFQVHRKTDHAELADKLQGVFNLILDLRRNRKQQVRKAARLRQHSDALFLDVLVAHQYSPNPWRAISRNRNDYSRVGSRYRKLFLKYDILIGVLDDAISLELIEQKLGFHDRTTNKGYQTRIKASDKLLNLISEFDVKHIVRNPDVPEDETIIKKDESGFLIDYVDDRFTNEDRESLRGFNNVFRETDINTDAVELRYEHDPTAITMKRVFNGDGGGRFYSGFWMNMPKADRLKLLLEDNPVCELDYGALHPTIAYAFKGIELSDDPYSIDGCERNEVKKAFLVLFNCRDRRQAISTIRSFGIKNAEDLLNKIEQKHEPIKGYFYNKGFGMTLQNTDAWIAERVMKKLMEQGVVTLPIHDSFVVAKHHEEDLRCAMYDSFYEVFNVKPIIK
jgi:hypothetical protein